MLGYACLHRLEMQALNECNRTLTAVSLCLVTSLANLFTSENFFLVEMVCIYAQSDKTTSTCLSWNTLKNQMYNWTKTIYVILKISGCQMFIAMLASGERILFSFFPLRHAIEVKNKKKLQVFQLVFWQGIAHTLSF